MIIFIASEIGSGKSCYAAKLAHKALKKGRPVYSNEHINGCCRITIEDLTSAVAPRNSLIILDETGTSLNSRNFKTTSQQFLSYLKISRHYGNDVVMISQTFNDTDKQARELASKVFIIRPLVKGWLSMVVRCRGKLGIGLDGQFAVQYKIGHIGGLLWLHRWFKMFDSFTAPQKDIVMPQPYSQDMYSKKDFKKHEYTDYEIWKKELWTVKKPTLEFLAYKKAVIDILTKKL